VTGVMSPSFSANAVMKLMVRLLDSADAEGRS
jgi:hypothetical protein